MTRAKTKSSWGIPALRVGGGAASLLGGVWVSRMLEIPHGFPESVFTYGIAPLAALAGFELGTVLGVWNRILTGALALLTAIICYFVYYWIFYRFVGGLIPAFFVMLSFGSTFFVLFAAFGIFGIQVLEGLDGRAKK